MAFFFQLVTVIGKLLLYTLGVSRDRRNAEIKRLNNTYLDVISTKKGLKESLEYMVENESYRWICKATYSLSPKPIRSQRIFNVEPETSKVQDSVNNMAKEKNNIFYSCCFIFFKFRLIPLMKDRKMMRTVMNKIQNRPTMTAITNLMKSIPFTTPL